MPSGKLRSHASLSIEGPTMPVAGEVRCPTSVGFELRASTVGVLVRGVSRVFRIGMIERQRGWVQS